MSKTNKGTSAGHSLPEWLDFVYLNKIVSIDEALVEKLSKTTFSMFVLKSVLLLCPVRTGTDISLAIN